MPLQPFSKPSTTRPSRVQSNPSGESSRIKRATSAGSFMASNYGDRCCASIRCHPREQLSPGAARGAGCWPAVGRHRNSHDGQASSPPHASAGRTESLSCPATSRLAREVPPGARPLSCTPLFVVQPSRLQVFVVQPSRLHVFVVQPSRLHVQAGRPHHNNTFANEPRR